MRRVSGKFKAISGAAKKSFYHSKRVVPSSGKEGSKEGVLVCVLVLENVRQKGCKPGPTPEEIESKREDCKRRKEELDNPTYVPEDGKTNTNKRSNKKSAEDGLGVVSFVFIFIFIELIYYLIQPF